MAKALSLFRLRPGKDMYFRFAFSNSLPREASNTNLAQPMKVNGLEGAMVEAFPDKFPSFTTVHQRAQVSVSVGTSSGLKQSRAWFLDNLVCCVEVHDE